MVEMIEEIGIEETEIETTGGETIGVNTSPEIILTGKLIENGMHTGIGPRILIPATKNARTEMSQQLLQIPNHL